MHNKTQSVVLTGLMAAVIAVMSQIQFPLPSGVPVTLQTFAVALAGYTLGARRGLAATGVYLLIGAIGLPVFAGFTGGVGTFVSPPGGYLWGFLPMAFICGLAAAPRSASGTFSQEDQASKKYGSYRRKMTVGLLSVLALACCHLPGVFWLAFITGLDPLPAFLAGSAPYLIKDVISMVAAYGIAKAIRRALQW